MLTSNLLTSISKVVNVAHAIGLCPFEFEAISNSVKEGPILVGSNRSKNAAFLVWTTFFVLKTVESVGSLAFRVLYSQEAQNNLSVDFSLQALYCNACLSLCCFNLNIWWKRWELAACFNNLVYLDKTSVQNEEKRGNHKTFKEHFAANLIPWAASNTSMMLAIYAVDPRNPRYWYWRLMDHLNPKVGGASTLFFALFEAHYQLSAYFLIAFNWFGYLVLFSHSLSDLLKRVALQRRSIEWLAATRSYNVLAVWSTLYNDCISIMWPTFIYMNVCNHVLFVYITVAHFDSLDFVARIFFPFWSFGVWAPLELFVYYIPGKVHQVSKDCVSALKASTSMPKQVRRSFPPIKVRVGNAMPIEKHAPLLILSIVANATINLLLFGRN